jgi:Na+-driven multidrug efflux pump
MHIYMAIGNSIKMSLESCIENVILNGDIVKRTLVLGVTSFLSQISLVAAMAAINNMIRKYGALDEIFGQEQYAQIPMAVVGIVMKFFQIVISIVVGMAAGCIPVVGYNMGAGLKDRVKKLFTTLLIAKARKCLRGKNKYCKGICMTCAYYKQCKGDSDMQ